MARFVTDRAYDYFDLGEESDEERAESSEDEIDIILHGTPQQKRHLRHAQEKEQQQKSRSRSPRRSRSKPEQEESASSSEDEFEREMNAELNRTVHMLEQSRGRKEVLALPASGPSGESNTAASSSGSSNAKKANIPFYDDIYFDSDDEDNYEGQGEKKVRRKHTQPSNDDLLYDPDMDDDDQKWVDEQRQRQHGNNPGNMEGGNRQRKGKKKSTAPTSDAVLDCPACMTTLCIDCQRHDVYANQFRAMFVMNCKINKSELLSVPEQATKKKFKKGKTSSSMDSASGSKDSTSGENGLANIAENGAQNSESKDKFKPVLCEECDTVVGVVDFDEVYHFFNVLASQP